MTQTKAFAETLAAWVRQSDPATAGNFMADALTNDLRPVVSKINSPVLMIGSFAQATDSASKARTRAAYESQLTSIRRHQLAMAEHAKHFVMIDDLSWLLQTMDKFLAANQH
jgi:hypothetical protein